MADWRADTANKWRTGGQTQPTNGGLATNNKYKKFKDSNEGGFQQMNDG
jgi:hypothetical protein